MCLAAAGMRSSASGARWHSFESSADQALGFYDVNGSSRVEHQHQSNERLLCLLSCGGSYPPLYLSPDPGLQQQGLPHTAFQGQAVLDLQRELETQGRTADLLHGQQNSRSLARGL